MIFVAASISLALRSFILVSAICWSCERLIRPALALPGSLEPDLMFAAFLMSAFHTVNHLFDISNTDPGWQGPFNFVSVLLLTILIFGLFRQAVEDAPQ